MAKRQGRGIIGRRVTLDGGKAEWRLEDVAAPEPSFFVRRGQKCGWVHRARVRFVRGNYEEK